MRCGARKRSAPCSGRSITWSACPRTGSSSNNSTSTGRSHATGRSMRSAHTASCGPTTRSRPHGSKQTPGSAPPRAARGKTRMWPRQQPNGSGRSAGSAIATPHQREHTPDEQRDHSERDQVAEADHDRTDDAQESLEGELERVGEARILRIRTRILALDVAFAYLDLDRGLGNLILQEVQPSLDVLDLQGHVVDQRGEPQDLRRRGRVGLDVAEQIPSVLQDLEAGAEVDELGRDVLPADVLELDLAIELVGEPAEGKHGVVEPPRRDAQGQRAGTLVARGGFEHEATGRPRDLRDARDAL